jgi:RNA polymerase sigma factor (sigma-70 family)
MSEPPVTRPSLLVRLRDAADGDAWRLFVELYAPLVYRVARKRGLQDADAADVTQEVLQAVSRAVRRLEYDPARGTFRGWLGAVARSKLNNFLAARQRNTPGSGDTAVQQLLEGRPDPADEDAQWEREYRQRLFAWAAEQVRPAFEGSTWRAFWGVAVEGRGAEEVGRELGLSVGAVYVAKSRVLARIRQAIQDVEAE